MGLQLTTRPLLEPVTLAQAKQQARIDSDLIEDDQLVQIYITAAREFAERYTGTVFLTQTWRQTFDRFQPLMTLAKYPVQRIESVRYQDKQGNWQTLPDTVWYLIHSNLQDQLGQRQGQSWPVTLCQAECVEVNYVAGYGNTASDVPDGIKHWILLRVATLYANREEVAVLNRGTVSELPFVDSLLDFHRRPVL